MVETESPARELSEDLKRYVGLAKSIENYEMNVDSGAFSADDVAEEQAFLGEEIIEIAYGITRRKQHYRELFDVLRERLDNKAVGFFEGK